MTDTDNQIELPVKLQAGQPAPREGVLVPVNPTYPYRYQATDVAAGRWCPTAVNLLIAIADAAEAPRPLQRGDKIMVGDTGAVYVQASMTSKFCLVRYEMDEMAHRVPLSVVRRITTDTFEIPPIRNRVKVISWGADSKPVAPHIDPEPELLPPTKCDECGDDPSGKEMWADSVNSYYVPCPACSGSVALDAEEAAIEAAAATNLTSVSTKLVVDGWVPVDGMVVERISDGKCFRLKKRVMAGWEFWTLAENQTDWRLLDRILVMFRPRVLRVGDVITDVETSYDSHSSLWEGSRIEAFDEDGHITASGRPQIGNHCKVSVDIGGVSVRLPFPDREET